MLVYLLSAPTHPLAPSHSHSLSLPLFTSHLPLLSSSGRTDCSFCGSRPSSHLTLIPSQSHSPSLAHTLSLTLPLTHLPSLSLTFRSYLAVDELIALFVDQDLHLTLLLEAVVVAKCKRQAQEPGLGQGLGQGLGPGQGLGQGLAQERKLSVLVGNTLLELYLDELTKTRSKMEKLWQVERSKTGT